MHFYVNAACVALDSASEEAYEANFRLNGDKNFRWEVDND